MGQTIQLWWQRTDAVGITLYSAPIDVSSVRDITVFLTILAVGSATVAVRAEHSLDPSNPDGWSPVGSTASGSALGNQTALVGGSAGALPSPSGHSSGSSPP